MTSFINGVEPLITLQVDAAGQVWLPEKLQKMLVPGTVLTVASRDNGTIFLRIEVQPSLTEAQPEATESLCRLKDEDGVLVFTGTVPENFNWEAFMQEERALRDRQLWMIEQ